MKIVVLQDDLFSYLQYMVKAYAGGGINPEEGLAIYHLNQAIKGAQSVDEAQVAKIKTGEANGNPVATVGVEGSLPPELPEERGAA